ncbi:MAG: hypothetical protein IPO25_04860 [Saprospiraceae bacterium]|nr:hypothetical protein [Saprospiraceae bacterium]
MIQTPKKILFFIDAFVYAPNKKTRSYPATEEAHKLFISNKYPKKVTLIDSRQSASLLDQHIFLPGRALMTPLNSNSSNNPAIALGASCNS